MAADSMTAARRTPLIAAVPKMLFPFLRDPAGHDRDRAHAPGRRRRLRAARASPDGTLELRPADADAAGPLLPRRACSASGSPRSWRRFMSGMAGNVTAFNTVWTYDIYQRYIQPRRERPALPVDGPHGDRLRHPAVRDGRRTWRRASTTSWTCCSCVFAFVNAPLFATFLLGMFWKRATGHGAFFGLLVGHARRSAAPRPDTAQGRGPGIKGGWLGLAAHQYPSEMAQNFWTAILAWISVASSRPCS